MLHKNYYLLLCNLSIDFWETMCYTVSITIRIKIVVAPYSIETRRVSTADAPRRDKNVQYTFGVFSLEYTILSRLLGGVFSGKIFFSYLKSFRSGKNSHQVDFQFTTTVVLSPTISKLKPIFKLIHLCLTSIN